MSSSNKVLVLALYVLFVLATCMDPSKATYVPPPCPPPPCSSQNNTITFYVQAVLANGTNNAVANAIPVAGIQGKAFDLQQFGTIYVFDVDLTTTPSPNSPVIGQAYGTFVVASLRGFVYQFSEVFKFTSGILAGSTFSTLGILDLSQQASNLPIVGGTNALTYATGFAKYQIISQQPNIVTKVTANYITAP